MKKISRVKGFTLIEMAISVLIVGVLLSAASQAYRIYLERVDATVTKDNIATISGAIGDFRTLHGRYPCPARLDAARTDAAYGVESTTDCTVLAPSGVWEQVNVSAPTITIVPTGGVSPPTPPKEHPKVVFGALPFRELNLDENQAVDGYGNRIFYVVTERLATDHYFQPDGGGIDIRNPSNPAVSTLEKPFTAHFVVFSAGKDGAGAYSRDGVQTAPCPAGTAESPNCSHTGEPIYNVAEQKSNMANAQHFDDVVSYFTQADIPLWQYSQQPGYEQAILQRPNGQVVAGFPGSSVETAQTSQYQFLVPGNAHLSNGGRLLTNQICDGNGNCMAPGLIASDVGLTCPNATPAMVAITAGQAKCDSPAISCGPGELIKGINVDGTPDCTSPTDLVTCPASSGLICSDSVTLPTGIQGATVTLHGGDSEKQTFTCTNGKWIGGTPSGLCVCSPASPRTRIVACGTGYSGTMKQTSTYTCPAGTWTNYVTVDRTDCTCTGADITANVACPAGYTGTKTQESIYVCNSSLVATLQLPLPPPVDHCVCATPPSQSLSCPSGYTGSITQNRTYDCITKTYGPWVTTANTCTCNAKTETKTVDCPVGKIANPKGITEHRDFTCSNNVGTWGQYITDSNDCIDAPVTVCHWTAQSSGSSGQSSGIGVSVNSQCDCTKGLAGSCYARLGVNNYTNYPACACQ